MPIDINNLPATLLQAVNEHVPSGAAWIPVAVLAGLAALGLILMAKGARLAPWFAALILGGVGAGAGSAIAGAAGTPLWPTVAACGVVGLALGIVLFRIWLALLVSTCLIIAALGVYGAQQLREPLNAYLSRGLDVQKQEVTLPGAPETEAARTTAQAELSGLWSHLTATVPTFQSSFYTILALAGLAGLVIGFVTPKIARAFWAATIGTALAMVAAYGLVQSCWPAGSAWLGQWGLIVAAVLWGMSLVCNWADVHGLRPKKPATTTAKPAAG